MRVRVRVRVRFVKYDAALLMIMATTLKIDRIFDHHLLETLITPMMMITMSVMIFSVLVLMGIAAEVIMLRVSNQEVERGLHLQIGPGIPG